MGDPANTLPAISLCMIVRNEVHCIERALQSAKAHVPEIIVVDTGSVDRTIDLAKKYADKLEFLEWVDFSSCYFTETSYKFVHRWQCAIH